MAINKLYRWKCEEKLKPICERGRVNCRFYRNDSLTSGCVALKALYCRLEEKPCAFYKPKQEKKNESSFR